MRASLAGRTPSSTADTSVASRHAVPDALSQFNVKTAAYGAGFKVTGGMRMIRLCRPGTLSPFRPLEAFGRNDGMAPCVHVSIAVLIADSPHARTNTTSNRYGVH